MVGAGSIGRTARAARLVTVCALAVVAQLAVTSGASANTFNATGGLNSFFQDGSSPPGTFGSPTNVTFNVTGFGAGVPSRVAVSITAEHTSVGDLDVVLIAPNGAQRTVFSRTGATSATDVGDESTLDGTYIFSDLVPAVATATSPTWWSEAASRSKGQPLRSGFYRASTAGPGGGANQSLSSGFTSIPTTNGTWTLRVRDGAGGSVGQITAASLDLSGAVTATPSSLGLIPDGAGAGPSNFGSSRDVTFPISGFSGASPTDVSLAMTISHTWVGDLQASLIAPGGAATALIFDRTGAGTAGSQGDDSDLGGLYRFFDVATTPGNWWTAATSASGTAAITPGNYRSSAAGGASGTGTQTLITPVFSGLTTLNGTWTLRLRDGWVGDTGSVTAAELQLQERIDTTAPATPTLSSTDPASPSASTTPKFKGAAEAGTIVRIHSDPFTCTNANVIATGTRAQFVGAGISAPATQNVSGNYVASAMDESGNVSGCSTFINYTHDDQAPSPPTITATDPASPANQNFPKFKGTAEAGSTVWFYDNATCSEPAAESGPEANFNGAGITIQVPNDAAVTLRAAARDAAGNQSSCSQPITYVEDSTSATPNITGTDPSSPREQQHTEAEGQRGRRGRERPDL